MTFGEFNIKILKFNWSIKSIFILLSNWLLFTLQGQSQGKAGLSARTHCTFSASTKCVMPALIVLVHVLLCGI